MHPRRDPEREGIIRLSRPRKAMQWRQRNNLVHKSRRNYIFISTNVWGNAISNTECACHENTVQSDFKRKLHELFNILICSSQIIRPWISQKEINKTVERRRYIFLVAVHCVKNKNVPRLARKFAKFQQVRQFSRLMKCNQAISIKLFNS